MKKLLLHPLFFVGLATRLLLVLVADPFAAREWYLPFLDQAIQAPFDPWSAWIASGGTARAFPYGYAMWLVLLPFVALGKLIGAPVFASYFFTLFAADFGLLLLMKKLIGERDKFVLGAYWLSPIVLFATYWLGYNDIVPVLLLTSSIYLARERMFLGAGALLVAAISAKLSMILAAPFFLLYLTHNRALRSQMFRFSTGIAISVVVLILPFLLSTSGLAMLFTNPEMGRAYQLGLNIGKGTFVYLVPLAYFLIIYAAWRIRRMNFELFATLLGLSFLLVVLLTSASPGWFIWVMPLLVLYQSTSDRIAIAIASMFSLLYLLVSIAMEPSSIPIFGTWLEGSLLAMSGANETTAISLLHTVLLAVGLILAIRLWRDAVTRNDFFRLSRKPFVIGVAGDSGAGKDTFANAITQLFGKHSVTNLSGDDYHLWDRQKPMWQVMTHLNPMANDLEGFAQDLVSLVDGKSVSARHYNHETGKMTKPFAVKSNDVIIASGLHALYLPILRQCYDLSIYLDINEDLRRHFKLERDVKHRGHSIERVLASFEKREPDSKKFIRPQYRHADLVLSLQPTQADALNRISENQSLRMKLVARFQNGLNELSLIRVLVGICGLHVDVNAGLNDGETEFTIEGECSAEDIAMAAHMLCPRLLEFLDWSPRWADGMLGLMQLLTICHINQALTRRFI